MGFNNFRLNVAIRVTGIALTIFCLFYLIQASEYYVILVFMGGLIIYQVIALMNLMENTNRQLIDFLSSIRYDDFSHSYRLTGRGGSFDQLNEEFNKVIEKFQEIRAEKEAEYQYLKNIIHHIGIGILSFDKKGEVQIINTAAKRIFQVNQLKNIEKLESFSTDLLTQLRQMRTGAKALVRVRNKEETIQLAVYAIELYLKGEEFKLITVQNIHSELEEQEMDAWQNLIRVLTHEIMNSVTPISSLATTASEELEHLRNEVEIHFKEELEDLHLAVQTIQRRSEGLTRFVSEFRSLTHIPSPKLQHVKVKDLFQHVGTLMARELQEHQIALETRLDTENLLITADRELIEQVLINLLKNAIYALQDKEEGQPRLISLVGRLNMDRPVIHVRDNGPGIDKDALDRIFIPFFSTKKAGSGIGLSLSRQIMRQHKGTITARTRKRGGTEVSLRF